MKKKSKRTIHVTVTVPKRLRESMKVYQEQHRVNWSKIACKAFEQFLETRVN